MCVCHPSRKPDTIAAPSLAPWWLAIAPARAARTGGHLVGSRGQVYPHGVRERGVEQFVVGVNCQLQDLRQPRALPGGRGCEVDDMPVRDDVGFVRPHGPERHQPDKLFVLGNNTLARARAPGRGTRRASHSRGYPSRCAGLWFCAAQYWG